MARKSNCCTMHAFYSYDDRPFYYETIAQTDLLKHLNTCKQLSRFGIVTFLAIVMVNEIKYMQNKLQSNKAAISKLKPFAQLAACDYIYKEKHDLITNSIMYHKKYYERKKQSFVWKERNNRQNEFMTFTSLMPASMLPHHYSWGN